MLIDISVDVNSNTPVYPGDPPFESECLASFEAGSHHCLNQLRMMVHTGTHLDAPAHYVAGGKTIDQMGLDRFYGECLVINAVKFHQINESIIDEFVLPGTKRILFKTVDPQKPSRAFGDMTPGAARRLVEIGTTLVGIDRLSVEMGEDMACHTILLGAEVALLECLNLSRVTEGRYRLWCLPLKLTGLEGAPCRAVLEQCD